MPGGGIGGAEGAAVAGGELLQRPLPGAGAGGTGGGGAEVAAQRRRGSELQDGAGDVVGVGPAEHPGVAVLHQRGGTALGHRDHRKAAGAGLEHDLAVGVGGSAARNPLRTSQTGKNSARRPRCLGVSGAPTL